MHSAVWKSLASSIRTSRFALRTNKAAFNKTAEDNFDTKRLLFQVRLEPFSIASVSSAAMPFETSIELARNSSVLFPDRAFLALPPRNGSYLCNGGNDLLWDEHSSIFVAALPKKESGGEPIENEDFMGLVVKHVLTTLEVEDNEKRAKKLQKKIRKQFEERYIVTVFVWTAFHGGVHSRKHPQVFDSGANVKSQAVFMSKKYGSNVYIVLT